MHLNPLDKRRTAMSSNLPCDCILGWKLIEDEDIGEELYIPVYASDDTYPDEEFRFCPICGERL